MLIDLNADQMSLKLAPNAGGSVVSLTHRDLEILRSGPFETGPEFDPLLFAAFPMVPFVGRIHDGMLHLEDETIILARNFPPEPHAIHGHGWKNAWSVENASKTTAILRYVHRPESWPWEYTTKQVFELSPDSLTLTLILENQSNRPMPAGFGWHPYFPRQAAQVALPTTHIWTADPSTGENRPRRVSPDEDLSRLQKAETLNLDTTFSLNGQAIQMTWPTHTARLMFDGVFGHATIYVPPGENYFCVEPITHAPNSMNGALDPAITGQKWLKPGETLRGTMTLKLERA